VDVGTARIVDDFIDDRSAAAFSPDGRHVAVQTGSPHFSHGSRHAARMSIDGTPVYPVAAGADVDFVSAPRWSADSRALAWLVRLHGTSTALVVWSDGALRETAISLSPAARADVFWAGSRVVVTAFGDDTDRSPARAWFVDAHGVGAKPVSVTAIVDPQASARALREQLVAAARATGLAQPDVWCRACAIATLPRASE